jgi:tetratricopeptide (TPR) repeat protein
MNENLELIKSKNVDYIVIGTIEGEKMVKGLNGISEDLVFLPIHSSINCIEKNKLNGVSIIYKIIVLNSKIKQLYQEGSYYYNKKDYSQAICKFKEALKSGSTLLGYYNMGVVYEKIGLINESINMYKKALEMEPHFQRVENKLNIFYSKQFLKQQGESLKGYKQLEMII